MDSYFNLRPPSKTGKKRFKGTIQILPSKPSMDNTLSLTQCRASAFSILSQFYQESAVLIGKRELVLSLVMQMGRKVKGFRSLLYVVSFLSFCQYLFIIHECVRYIYLSV